LEMRRVRKRRPKLQHQVRNTGSRFGKIQEAGLEVLDTDRKQVLCAPKDVE